MSDSNSTSTGILDTVKTTFMAAAHGAAGAPKSLTDAHQPNHPPSNPEDRSDLRHAGAGMNGPDAAFRARGDSLESVRKDAIRAQNGLPPTGSAGDAGSLANTGISTDDGSLLVKARETFMAAAHGAPGGGIGVVAEAGTRTKPASDPEDRRDLRDFGAAQNGPNAPFRELGAKYESVRKNGPIPTPHAPAHGILDNDHQ
ncbi:hypothetical protein PYCC9005_001665 [Savitreella phatthalungensis]